MSVIEIIRFTTHPETTSQALQQALERLDRELGRIGGFQARTLYQDGEVDHGWLLEYRWASLRHAKESMGKVAMTDAFVELMALVADPRSMSMSYGIPVR